MGQQLPLPAGWALRFASGPDLREQLGAIERDKREALGDVRAVLDRYAEKYRIPPREVTAAITGYAADMLSDLFYETTDRLEREIEAESPVQ